MIFDILTEMIGNTEYNSEPIFSKEQDDIFWESKNRFLSDSGSLKKLRFEYAETY